MFTRRSFVALAAMGGVAACARPAVQIPAATPVVPDYPPMPAFYDALYDEPYPVPAVQASEVAPHLRRQRVDNPWPNEPHGTIIVDPDAALLHFVEDAQSATRYGVSVGAIGFSWEGVARLQFTRDWPRWKVPADTIARRPELEQFSVANGGMDPGPDNPMGARALYLFQNGKDTLYRVHGSATPRELGRAVSSGCIRMLNQDVIHLEKNSVHGSRVIVLPSMKGEKLSGVY
ncbi:MAG: L,D-transpeptidase [Sulfitobacter sp.]